MCPPTRDHIRPRSRLTADARSLPGALNRAYVCERCNQDKADLSLVAFLAILICRHDARAARVAGVVQSLAARGLFILCDTHDMEGQQ